MIKVSITLPSTAQITVESEEVGVIHEVLARLLQDLPRDLMHVSATANGTAAPVTLPERGVEVPRAETPGIGVTPAETFHPTGVASQPPQVASHQTWDLPVNNHSPDETDELEDDELSEEELDFAEFCQATNPVGDMRRVVVAAEGARRFLGQPTVDAEGLEVLFLLAGWPPAHNFTQTIRNSARTKFRWLERVPGQAGHYTVSDIGRRAIGLAE